MNQFLKGKTRSQILHVGKERKFNRMFIKQTLDRFRETQSTEDRQHPGRPKSSRTPAAIEKIRDKIRKNSRQSMRKMAKKQGIRDILEGSLKPWAEKQLRCQHWTSQQDGATSHTARQVQQRCQNNCLGLISKEQ